jgi:putative membrane-bound dehydrogenase-like protein
MRYRLKAGGIGWLSVAALTVFGARPLRAWADGPGVESHDPAVDASHLQVDPDLAIHLFAAEPMLANPTAIDVDERGRVWVCEAVNYRAFQNADVIGDHTEGDRIVIVEDTDGDARADRSVVFYQGHDVDSAHGVMVVPGADGKGTKALVSALDRVFYLIDDDGDLRADRKEVLFTGIEGVQHDHGIHSFHFGPDGKLYFNFGNEGKRIKDREGRPVVDLQGHVVDGTRQPYQEGMVFRCDVDGSHFETLAWNFRNNWEVCVDSFGTMWQSDNDDDGNRACRLNYVMEYGNYGYKDEMTGAAWSEPRTNREVEIPRRHWHQNDPGVVPTLYITGAGAPTGMCVYESGLLPQRFRGALIHADAGPNLCLAYATKPEGGGYTAEPLKLIDGSGDKWFRPSDVCVAPDGSLIVADWYDPGVGGHRMEDIRKGRLFRLAPQGEIEHRYRPPAADVSSAQAAARLLKSPNMAARVLAWTTLQRLGEKAKPALEEMRRSPNPVYRARALWVLGKLGLPAGATAEIVRAACQDSEADVRVVGVRLARQLLGRLAFADFKGTIPLDDPSAAVRREILLGLHQVKAEWLSEANGDAVFSKAWAQLARQYDGEDRWYLEALGIAAEGRWDECLAALDLGADRLKTDRAARDIVWRSRASNTCELVASLIADGAIPEEEVPRLFRALDFQADGPRQKVLRQLAFDGHDGLPAERVTTIRSEALSRLREFDASHDEHALAVLDQMLDACAGSEQFVRLVDKFGVGRRYADLLALAQAQPESQLAVDSLVVLYGKGQASLVAEALGSDNLELVEKTLLAMYAAGDNRGNEALLKLLADGGRPLSARRLAVKALGATLSGAQQLVDMARRKDCPSELRDALAATLRSARWPPVLEAAASIFPAPPSKDNRALPALGELVEMKGDSARGKAVFLSTGTCAKCHQPNDGGRDIGPNLSDIGNKLARQAMFESILYPSAAISHNFENYLVFTDDGRSFGGLLVSESDAEIRLKDENGIVHSIAVDAIEEKRKSGTSLMPANIQQLISTQELVDVVDYLSTLKEKRP